MKKIYLFICIVLFTKQSFSQQNYCDFEGNKFISFNLWNGTLDSMAVNPGMNLIDSSAMCAKYVRDTMQYSIIKLYPNSPLTNVSAYASNVAGTPKISMKLYTTAPVGTVVLLQLGIRSKNTYPGGIHSEYMSTTSVQNAWQPLMFDYWQSPAGSLASADSIDKIILLFDPGSANTDTYYMDDITGPPLQGFFGVEETAGTSFRLYQNYPNPVAGETYIKFRLNTAGHVSLRIVDMIGATVATLLDREISTGAHSVPFSANDLPSGIYFYVLTKDSAVQTKKLMVSR